MNTVEVSAKELKRRYIDECEPVRDISRNYGISVPTLYAMLDKLEIPRRLPRSGTTRPILVD